MLTNLNNQNAKELFDKGIIRIRGYVKVLESGKTKFSVFESKMNDKVYRIKFTRTSGVELPNKSGYYMVYANVEDVNKTVEKTNRDGKEYINNIIWIKKAIGLCEDIKKKEEVEQRKRDELYSLTNDEKFPF